MRIASFTRLSESLGKPGYEAKVLPYFWILARVANGSGFSGLRFLMIFMRSAKQTNVS